MGLNIKKRLKKKEKAEHLDQEPKLKKPILFMLSSNHNKETKQLLKNLYQITKDNSVFRQNNSNQQEWQENNLKLNINQKNHRIAESICNKLNYGLYVVANSNKKRPVNFGFGRIYNKSILDCCQLKVDKFVPVEDFKSGLGKLHINNSYKNIISEKVNANSRPLIISQGAEFSQDSGPLKTVRNILFDIFRGPSHQKISLENIKQVIVLSLLDEDGTSSVNGTESSAKDSKLDNTLTSDYGSSHLDVADSQKEEKGGNSVVFRNPRKLLFRRYSITLTKSDTSTKSEDNLRLPNVKLNEIGPSIDFLVEEVMEPDKEAFKSATKLPKKPKKLIAGSDLREKSVSTKRKNVKTTALGHVEGKVYVNRQDLDDLYTPHTKKLKKNPKA